jgi:hypothetical protein
MFVDGSGAKDEIEGTIVNLGLDQVERDWEAAVVNL